MGSISLFFFFFFFLTVVPLHTISGRLFTEFLYPNFTVSNYLFIDNNGAFLSSINGSFKAVITTAAGPQSSGFYFSVIHLASNEIIWSANPNSPISNSDKLSLTVNGLSISSATWSTPPLKSAVRALQLREDGNLVLIDQLNGSLWESFDFPSDTVVFGQRLPAETSLSVAGDYRFLVSEIDAVLQWNGLTYWKLSMDASAFRDSSSPVEYMGVNQTGFYLFGSNQSVVFQVGLTRVDFRVAKLDSGGRFIVKSFVGNRWVQDFSAPGDNCKLPFFCGQVGLCTNPSGSGSGSCSCSSGFHNDPERRVCVPTNSDSLPSACNGNSTNSTDLTEISYVKLGPGIDYFANEFHSPVVFGTSFSACETLCSMNCSCLGFFYANSSGSCYLLKNQLGSVMSNRNDRTGYIKTIGPRNGVVDDQSKKDFPIAALVLLPSTGFFLLMMLLVIGFIWRRRDSKTKLIKLGRPNSNSSADLDTFSIPGLPVRFDYDELESATENFGTQIGCGGFGSVYKGTLPDKSIVAVKKITNLGNQGKKEFCTEIAVIGKIHHVNLVKLRGFCAQGRQRLLVYEYMNRGSLDRTLFRAGPVLEWQERVEIALGTARGLAYLHSGCEHKIIHCDIKPENILLHDHFQVKISDFGLSKLLSPEQSSHFTTMRGTRGYLAPEWLTSSAISDKTDVYSYGMVLLEIVSGRKNCSMRTHSTHTGDDESGSTSGGVGGPSSASSSSVPVYFPLLALDKHEQRRYLELADKRLEGRVTSEDVERFVRIALCCVHEDPNLRPSMVSVVSMLEGTIPLGEPRLESLNFLRFYGQRFIEASGVEGSNGENRFMPFPQVINGSQTSTTSGSAASLSYISSQQISGPR